MSDEPHKELSIAISDCQVSYKFFKTAHLDKDQVRVSEVSPTEFRIKCGKQLTDREIRGAIVKYLLSKQRRLNG